MAKLDSGAMTIGNNDNWREIFDDQNATAVAANQATADLAPIINGKRCALSVASGGFVLLRNSTITGKADGAYTAAKAIPANTDLDGSYLTAVSGGVANALNSKIADLGFIVDLGSQTIASGVVIDLVVANLSEAKCVIPFQGNYSTGAQRQLNLTLLQSGGKWYCGVWNQSSSSVTARLMFYCIR